MSNESHRLLESPRPDHPPDVVAGLGERLFGVSGRHRPLGGERDQNVLIEDRTGAVVLKIANPQDPPEALDMVTAAIEHLTSVDPGLSVSRLRRTSSGRRFDLVDIDGVAHAVAMFEFLAGAPAAITTSAGRRGLGGLAARIDLGLRGFFHPHARRPLLWDLTRLAELRAQTTHLDPADRSLVVAAMERFDSGVAPLLDRLRAQPIHGDLHADNVIAEGSELMVIDFGDMVHAPLVVEVAVAATYQCFGTGDPITAMSEVVAAYDAILPLEREEARLVPRLVMGRLAQSLTVAAWRAELHPDNHAYITSDVADTRATLGILTDLDLAAAGDDVARACGYPPHPVADAGLRRRRAAALGPSLSLSYAEPVHVVEADGVWLVDAAGERYLDAYNNVPQVGHSRPEVVRALARQAAVLTTNTRYLTDRVVDYAERLAGLMPAGLEVVMFVNSGSEANDLAYQIAQAVTGRRGVIVTDHAYHGATLATAAMSPEEFATLPRRVATTPAPPGGPPARGLAEAMSRLATEGEEPAMFICDTVFSSDGIFEVPDGWLREAYRVVRESGALCVADEVQAGFGRVGRRMWGFATDDAIPDIVTLGKPMGNGHPMGAVVTTREVAEHFAAGWHFFSTFAGSPVAAAVGSAVLDVLEAEDLAGRAERVGGRLRAGLRAIGHPAMTDVRGPGLFVGVELADGDLAAEVVERMRRRRVLIGRTGPRANVLKIRPPLVFGDEHADRLVETLAGSLPG